MTIIERTWRRSRQVTEAGYERDLTLARKIGHPVHEWAGTDRSGAPLTVVWVAGRRSGSVLSAYECQRDDAHGEA